MTSSAEDIYQAQKLALWNKPYKLIESGELTIKTKDADLIKLKLNSVQKLVSELIKGLLKINRPIRLWILKARQMGISTLLEAIIYSYTSQRENVNSVVIADDLEGSNYIFEMQKLYQEYLEQHSNYFFAPKLKYSNEKKLEFDEIHSQVMIDTSNKCEKVGRKYTFRMVHLCLAADNQVLVNENRIKNIRNVVPGDKVYTHLGHWAEVHNISKTPAKIVSENLLEITTSGNYHFPIKCTPNHLLYVRDKKNNTTLFSDKTAEIFRGNTALLIAGSTKTGARKTGRGIWKEAKELKKGDYLGIPLRIPYCPKERIAKLPEKDKITGKKWIKGEVNFDREIGFVFGLYLAEGCIKRNKTNPAGFTLEMGQGEKFYLDRVYQAIKPYIQKYRFKRRKGSKTIVGEYYGVSFAKFLESYLGSKDEKYIPNMFFRFPKPFLLGLLEGYFVGDGHISKNQDVIYASSIRPQFLLQIRDLLMGLGIGYSSLDYKEGGYLYGRNCRAIWTLRLHGRTSQWLRSLLGFSQVVRENNNTVRRDWRLGRRHCWIRVEKIREIPHINQDVYDLVLTHKDHSYRHISGLAVHNSECAYFERSLKSLMLGISQTVPNLPETMIFGETTANGMGGDFFEIWEDTQKLMKKKATDWIGLFLPWFLMDEYRLNLERDYPIDGIVFGNTTEKLEFLNEEKRMQTEGIEYELPEIENGEIVFKKKVYKIDRQQINWRRWYIVNQCSGDWMAFRQEYPSTAREAFLSTGDLFFDRRGLEKQQVRHKKVNCNIVLEDGKAMVRPDRFGKFTIYELPSKNTQADIGGDPAEGIIKEDGTPGDKSAAVVLDKFTNKTKAVYNQLTDPDTFAHDLILFGKLYNNACIACENKGYGTETNRILYKNYGNVFRKVREKKGAVEETEELGFNTNSVTRPQILAQLNAEIREGSTQLLDEELIDQCWSFIRNPDKNGRPEAREGKNDDLVMARAIAGKLRQLKPYIAKTKPGMYASKHIEKNAGLGF